MRLNYLTTVPTENIKEVRDTMIRQYFPPALYNTDNVTSNSIVSSLLNYFTLPLAEYVDILRDFFPIYEIFKSLETIEARFLEILSLTAPIKKFADVLNIINDNVINTDDRDDSWVVPDIEYFQSFLPIMSSNFYPSIEMREFITSGGVNDPYCLTFGWSGFTSPEYSTIVQEPIGVYDNANN